MSSCNVLALDDELPQAVPTTVKNTRVIPVDMSEDVHPDLVHIINNRKQLSWGKPRQLNMSLTQVRQPQ